MKTLVGTIYSPTGEVWVKNPINGTLSLKRNCKTCGKEFYAFCGNVNKGMGWTCCRTCARRMIGDAPPVECTCKQCGKPFTELASRVKEGKGVFCSTACYAESLRCDPVMFVCPKCGVKFEKKPYKQGQIDRGEVQHVFCSMDCYLAAQKTGVIVKCGNPACRNDVYRQKGSRKRFCSWKCSAAVICGTKHHLWKADKIAREKFEFTHVQRRLIFARYSHECAVTGLSREEVRLHIHHLKAIEDGGVNTIDNGIPLCVDVHKKVHYEGFDLTPFVKS